jgi:hypothetical protein
VGDIKLSRGGLQLLVDPHSGEFLVRSHLATQDFLSYYDSTIRILNPFLILTSFLPNHNLTMDIGQIKMEEIELTTVICYIL